MRALMLRQAGGVTNAAVEEVEAPRPLEDGDVLLRVHASGINYKDALAITVGAPVVRQWPMVPGIDGVGVVTASRDPDWRVGDRALINGYGVGEVHWGCLAEQACLKGRWLVRPPAHFSEFDCMAIGTAGYTAMLCVLAIVAAGVRPEHGPVLVTGASGGVGSFAVLLLSQRGYTVSAVSGKATAEPYLRELGAAEVLPRAAFAAPGKPMQKERWAAAVDCVGSHTLANVCAQMRYGGVVTACGLAQGSDLATSVMPFILRSVLLQGVDSVMASAERRVEAWDRLGAEVGTAALAKVARAVPLSEAVSTAQSLLFGSITGRVVVTC